MIGRWFIKIFTHTHIIDAEAYSIRYFNAPVCNDKCNEIVNILGNKWQTRVSDTRNSGHWSA